MHFAKTLHMLLAAVYIYIHSTAAVPLPHLLRRQQQTNKEPLQAADVSTNLTDYQYAHGWLHHYGYIPEVDESRCILCPANDCNPDCLQALSLLIADPLIKYKMAYGINAVDGTLTSEVLTRMKEKRCQRPDYDTPAVANSHKRVKRFTKLTNFNWNLATTPVITISFKKYLKLFSVTEQQRLVMECASLWAGPTALTFQLKDFGPETNIGIDFIKVDGPWKSLGTGQSPNYNPPGYSYMNLDIDEPWRLNKENNKGQQGVSLKWALCHEMGHNLNLGHSNVRESLMYPTGHGQDESRLSNDDLNGIVSLYGGPNGQTVIGPGAALLGGNSQSSRTRNIPQQPSVRQHQDTVKTNTQGRRRSGRRNGRRTTTRTNRRNRTGSRRRRTRRPQKLVATAPPGQQMLGVVAAPQQRPNTQVVVRPQSIAPSSPPQPSQRPAPQSNFFRQIPRTTQHPSQRHSTRTTWMSPQFAQRQTQPTNSAPQLHRPTTRLMTSPQRRPTKPTFTRRLAPAGHVRRAPPPGHVHKPRPDTV